MVASIEMGPGATIDRPDDLRPTLDAIRRIVQALRTATRETERRFGISAAQLFALRQLASAPGASVNELAALTFTHQSSVSVVVARLAKKRLVAKVTSPEDRRRVRLALTDAGRALLKKAPEPVQDQLIAGISSLRDADRRTMAVALTQIAGALRTPVGAVPMFFEEKTSPRTRRSGGSGPRRRSRSRG